MQMFYRMILFNGLANSPFSNGISYQDFRNGYFFATFDLTTSGKAGTNFVIPTVRLGHLRLNVQLNAPLNVDMTALLYCEFTSTLFIHKNGHVTSSYV